MDLNSPDLARIFRMVGQALLAIYAVTVLASMFPLALIDPVWIERVCGSLRGGVSFPLIGSVFMLLEGAQWEREVEAMRVTLLRRLSVWVSIGFLLMVPLQTWAGIQVVRQSLRSTVQQLTPYETGLQRIRAAGTGQELIAALASLPGAPSLGGTLKQPLPVVREQLITQIQPQIAALRTQLQERSSQLWQEGLLRWSKDATVALFSALAFAAIGRSRPDRPTFLDELGAVPVRVSMFFNRRDESISDPRIGVMEDRLESEPTATSSPAAGASPRRTQATAFPLLANPRGYFGRSSERRDLRDFNIGLYDPEEEPSADPQDPPADQPRSGRS